MPRNQLICYCDPFSNSNSFLMVNQDILTVFSSARLTLDDLLMLNSRSTFLVNSTLTPKELNRFLKHWMKGSNPNLKYLKIQMNTDDVSEDAVLEGMDARKMMADEKRSVEILYDIAMEPSRETIRGGYDIKEGKATILLKNGDRTFCFEMFVWNLYNPT
uniref:FBA_2 domain-containing protein n=2 Tax=Caenorhabditis tropicalis TaxID=1561998 RepID=A0A1I7U1U7_9PELO